MTFGVIYEKNHYAFIGSLCGRALCDTCLFPRCVSSGFDDHASHAAASRPRGFDTSKPITIKTLKETARDDDFVTLRGRFTKHVRSDKYLFTDEAGDTIVAELDDDKDWSHVSRNAPCEISAKVDKDWNRVELDVKRVTPLR